MTELELSQVGSKPLVATATGAVTIALASIGIPLTKAKLCCPDGKAETLKAFRSVIWAGAAHVVSELDVATGVGGGIESTTVPAEIDGDTDTVR